MNNSGDEGMQPDARARLLVHALPYIQKFRNKTIVVKYGGNAMQSDELKNAVIDDVILMACVGIRTVLVHGGGPEIEAMLKKTGKESRFINGLRYTDEETMDIVQMVLCGKINKEITALIEKKGGKAIGICGIDGGMLKARLMKGEDDLGLVGEIEQIDITILDSILETGIIPVISSVAYGIGEAEGKALNINADIAAAKIAAVLSAEKLVLMTDVRGILRDLKDESSLIKSASVSQLETLKKEGVLCKGMIPKSDCCIMALNGGVEKAHIIDGRLPHALLVELFTNEGIGTEIIRNE
ncbi:MAG: acetylglutamate kinase [Treponema sp.]|nr:acetylglutamate kinase [Treponema sp.]MCL2271323.1 acetylglutamate kinase [Treponema sp.]